VILIAEIGIHNIFEGRLLESTRIPDCRNLDADYVASAVFSAAPLFDLFAPQTQQSQQDFVSFLSKLVD
jgi:hypothetical protein